MAEEALKFYTVGWVAALVFIYWTVTECLRIRHSSDEIEDLQMRVQALEDLKDKGKEP